LFQDNGNDVFVDRIRARRHDSRHLFRVSSGMFLGAFFGLAVATMGAIAALYLWGLVEWFLISMLGT
jgi:hypothetical protein